MKNDIPEFLKEKIKRKKCCAAKFPDDIKQFMLSYAEFYKWNLEHVSKNKKASVLQTIFLLMSKGYDYLPKCEFVGCDRTVYINYHQKLTKGCCVNHSQKISILEKYGVLSVANLETTRQKIVATCLEKYGVETNLQHEKTKIKIRNTCIERYGVDQPMKSAVVKNKRKKTFMDKFGVEEITSSQLFKEKALKTMMEKYGVPSALQNSECLEKLKNTNLERYGVHNPTLNPEILERAIKNSYLRKEYVWKSGEISIVQGNEPIVLKELEDKGYTFDEIKTSSKDMPEFWYEYEGSKKRYFPDFFIPAEHTIIEVKSPFTLELELEKNNLKFQAVKDAGYNFILEIR